MKLFILVKDLYNEYEFETEVVVQNDGSYYFPEIEVYKTNLDENTVKDIFNKLGDLQDDDEIISYELKENWYASKKQSR